MCLVLLVTVVHCFKQMASLLQEFNKRIKASSGPRTRSEKITRRIRLNDETSASAEQDRLSTNQGTRRPFSRQRQGLTTQEISKYVYSFLFYSISVPASEAPRVIGPMATRWWVLSERKLMGGMGGKERNKSTANLLLLGVQLFPEGNAKLLAQALESLEVLLVLVLVLDLGLDACERKLVSLEFQDGDRLECRAVELCAYPRKPGRR